MLALTSFFTEVKRQQHLSVAQVVPDSQRCMQCGICSYNCPVDIDVRNYAWHGVPIEDPNCLTCGQCVVRCPRSALRFAYVNQADAGTR
jgi:heterodisulfide reductase subunit C